MANVVLDPDHAGNQRFQQNIINRYHPYLKEMINDYRIIRDDSGNITAITPYSHLIFKDGSDMVIELQKQQSEYRVH